MNASVGSLSEMVNSSIQVLTKPSVATFEQYERRGTLQRALVYVGAAALVSAVIGLLLGMLGGLFSDTRGVLENGLRQGLGSGISVFVNFLLFSGAAYYVGRGQGGTGSLDEVAYTFALFIVPIVVVWEIVSLVLTLTIVGICLIPFLGIATLIACVYYAFLGVQSSMNLMDSGRSLITLGAAALATIVGNILVTFAF